MAENCACFGSPMKIAVEIALDFVIPSSCHLGASPPSSGSEAVMAREGLSFLATLVVRTPRKPRPNCGPSQGVSLQSPRLGGHLVTRRRTAGDAAPCRWSQPGR